jgi:hypothetical protein
VPCVGKIERARIRILKLVQQEEFTHEIQDLTKSNSIRPSSKLFGLCPFLNNNGFIRVGGRLKNTTSLDIFQRHQIVLPVNCHFSRLLLIYEHERCMHGGPQATLNSVRLKYWPINGRNTVRKIILQCIKCFRCKPIVVQPIMGNLPEDRVELARAFLKCGIDFASPFMVKTSLRRNAPLIKGYVCVFVCSATKTIHLELVGDVSTTAFINALNHFDKDEV